MDKKQKITIMETTLTSSSVKSKFLTINEGHPYILKHAFQPLIYRLFFQAEGLLTFVLSTE